MIWDRTVSEVGLEDSYLWYVITRKIGWERKDKHGRVRKAWRIAISELADRGNEQVLYAAQLQKEAHDV